MTPTLAGFQEFRDGYVQLQLRGDRREARRCLDGLVTPDHPVFACHVVAAAQARIVDLSRAEAGNVRETESLSREAAINRIQDALRKAGVGITPQAQES